MQGYGEMTTNCNGGSIGDTYEKDKLNVSQRKAMYSHSTPMWI